MHDTPKPVYVPSLDRVYIQQDGHPHEPIRIGVYRPEQVPSADR